VWDREIILTALADYYDKDVTLLLQDIEKNYTNVTIFKFYCHSYYGIFD
jgi:hypothetical protein